MQELVNELSTRGFAFTPILDGEFHRFDRNGKELNAWFVGHEIKPGLVIASYGDWSTKERYQWKSGAEPIGPGASDEEYKKHQEKIARAKQIAQEEAAKRALYIFERAKSEGVESHAYTKNKKLKVTGSVRCDEHGNLVVPLYDENSLLTTLQFITPSGDKRLMSGGRKGFLFIKPGSKTLYLCEGWATACSVQEAIGEAGTAVMCVDSGGLEKAAHRLGARYKDGHFVICADNDQWTKGNPGLEAAGKAQKVFDSMGITSEIRFPAFGPGDRGQTDWNDYMQQYGREKTKEGLMGAAKGIVKEKKTKEAKAQGPSEKEIADSLLRDFGENICRQDRSLFLYDGKKWVELISHEIDQIKNKLNYLNYNGCGATKVESLYKTFFRYVPGIPKHINLFIPNPNVINFDDGTLHLRRDILNNKYTSEFMPHNPKDFISWVLPVKYNIDRSQKNALFEQLLNEVFEKDPHKEEKVLSLQEMAGAMLLAAFDQTFFLTGVSGSRKSTVAKVLLKNLRGPRGEYENVSFVDPSNMEGFQIEGMINKLVNINTDIDDERPLHRGFMKRLSDRLPFQVNRKGKPVINAILPCVHVYCCNKLPPQYEKSRALERRVTVIDFLTDLTNDRRGEEIKNYEDTVYESQPEGVLAFALAGVDRLLANGGKFTTGESSKENIQKWGEKNNITRQFIDAVKHGEVGPKGAELYLQEGIKMHRGTLGRMYLEWLGYGPDGRKNQKILNHFYTELTDLGYKLKLSNSLRYVSGFGVRGQEQADTPEQGELVPGF